jgi:hypothetical protein
MSKAYDSVNLNLFEKALHHINMPFELINILTNLLTDRQNRVITNFGLTNPYTVKNGIDQGETITPLFWCIYYDLLIHKIASQHEGYLLSTTWKTHLQPSRSQSLHTSTSVLAYMDDTLWIAKTKQELEQITQTASSFYLMANIQINAAKSVFISNSPLSNIQFCNSTLESILASQPFKFLGCWFTLNNKHTEQIKII